ncbi:hypothetical protein GUJ93_ZPchr0006g42213 [Zizania palustris]|uniref:Uncharacterized protein n=1 Tax=Zizania palustris TaxID=103762 RepID=A0A8J5SRN6_ZIZPA|nr:hypothetical protein GUJ93_ZPchr0006g42213 [Zizania palustris]
MGCGGRARAHDGAAGFRGSGARAHALRTLSAHPPRAYSATTEASILRSEPSSCPPPSPQSPLHTHLAATEADHSCTEALLGWPPR